MHYFTKQLWADLNDSLDASAFNRLSNQWDKNLTAYRNQLELLKPRLTRQANQFFTRVNLHDGRLLSFVVGDDINYDIKSTKLFDRNSRKTSASIQVFNYEQDSLYKLKYTGIRRVAFDFPTVDPLFYEAGDQIGDWGYDELTAVDQDYLRHEILFASGTIILIEFKYFSYKRIRVPTKLV